MSHRISYICHATTFKLAVSKGWLGNLPRLTSKMITKNPPYTMETSLGHLDKRRINQHPTKRKGTRVPGTTNGSSALAVGATTSTIGSQEAIADNETETVSPMIFTRLIGDDDNLEEWCEPDGRGILKTISTKQPMAI